MARTSAKAKKQKQDVDKSKKDAQETKNEAQGEESNSATDKENDNTNFEVEKILHSRVYRGKLQFLVRWKGYNENSDTWEIESNLQACKDILDKFKEDNDLTNEKSTQDSDRDEDSEVSNDEENDNKDKGGKKSKKRKSASKSKTGESKKSKMDEEKKSAHLSSDDEENDDEETPKDKEKTDTGKKSKKATGKKTKQDSKKIKTGEKTEDDSDDSETDGKNYEVEKIVEVHTRKDGKREFLIRWKGYRPSEDTWEPEAHLDCKEMIEKFMAKVDKLKSIPARELREAKPPTKRLVLNVGGNRSNLRKTTYRVDYQE